MLPSLATPGSGSILDLAEYTDAQGNTYQAGSFTGAVHFGPLTFSSPGAAEVVVAKRNAAGVYQWAVAGGGAGEQRAKALAVDAAGNVVVTGSFPTPTATFGAAVLTNAQTAGTSTSDVFVARVTAAGTWDWAVSAGGGTRINGDDYATAVAVDALGGVYVAGTFTSSLAFFGTIQVPSPDPNGRDIAFVAKLLSNGQWSWVRNNQDYGSNVTSVTTDGLGNTYLSGGFVAVFTMDLFWHLARMAHKQYILPKWMHWEPGNGQPRYRPACEQMVRCNTSDWSWMASIVLT